MKVFITILGVGFLIFSVITFYVLTWFSMGIGISGTGGGGGVLPLFVSAVFFIIGCLIIYNANKKKDEQITKGE